MISGGENHQRSLNVGGFERSYHVHVPQTYNNYGHYPLLVFFHGGNGNGRSAEHLTGFSNLSDKNAFLAAYPNGFEGHWNDGRGTTLPELKGVDDIAFFDALLTDISSFLNVNANRVYAAGMSNGAIFTHRLAYQRSKVLAAAATVAGTMAEPLNWDVGLFPALSMVIFHGTHDVCVPYQGGEVKGEVGGFVLSVPVTFKNWFRSNHCGGPLPPVELPDVDPNDGTRVTLYRHPDCRQQTRVYLYVIHNGGHTWPGSTRDYPPASGNVCQDINASEVIWEFFSEQARIDE